MNVELNKELIEKVKNKLEMKSNSRRKREISRALSKKSINKSYYILLVFMVLLASVSIKENINKNASFQEVTFPVFSSSDAFEKIENENNSKIKSKVTKILKSDIMLPIDEGSVKNIEYTDGISKIETNPNEKIKNIAEGGIVENIYLDYCYGYTVVVRYDENIRCKYCNLDSDIYVKIGQNLKKGEVLGRSVEYSLMDSSYIFFMFYYDNMNIDIKSLI